MNVSKQEFLDGISKERERRKAANKAKCEWQPDPYVAYFNERRTAYLMALKRRVYNG